MNYEVGKSAQSPPRCTKCNSPLIDGHCTNTILLYNGLLLSGFNVPIKGLTGCQQNTF